MGMKLQNVSTVTVHSELGGQVVQAQVAEIIADLAIGTRDTGIGLRYRGGCGLSNSGEREMVFPLPPLLMPDPSLFYPRGESEFQIG